MAGTKNGVLVGKNADFTQFDGPNSSSGESNGLVLDNQIWLGSTALNAGLTHINVKTLTAGTGVTFTSTATALTVSLTGGGVAVEHLTGNTGGQLNPDGSNNFNILAAVVAAGTSPITVAGLASTLTVNAQISQALAAADATKIGLSNFDSTDFSVTATGFVTLSTTGAVQIFEANTGSATPVANTIQILGGPGVTTSATGSAITINSVVFTDQAGSISVLSDSGSFATAAITLTTPAVPAQGELLHFVCTTAGQLIVDAASTHLIRIGTLVSSAGGSASSTAIGDSLTLRWSASDTTWYCTSCQGTWIMA